MNVRDREILELDCHVDRCVVGSRNAVLLERVL